MQEHHTYREWSSLACLSSHGLADHQTSWNCASSVCQNLSPVITKSSPASSGHHLSSDFCQILSDRPLVAFLGASDLSSLAMRMERSIPIQTILNSPSRRPDTPVSNPSGSEQSSPTSDIYDAFADSMPAHARNKKSRDTSDLQYCRPNGRIIYPAYQNQNDTASMELMEPFNIYPFGAIEHWCAHIPYSSDKKDLKIKTGREKLEVFVYTFTDPSDKQTWEVMWDYKSGLVRISPFFKNRKHKKTGPAKMLDANPGMRDVTVQVTGGNRIAQGYWVQFHCARAVCAKFCYEIRGALIPIFGPEFPDDCTRYDQKGFNCWSIDPTFIQEAVVEIKKHLFTTRALPMAITSHPQRIVEDQYAGSPMETNALYRYEEHHYMPPTAPYGPSPPQRYTPGPARPRPIEYMNPRGTPVRDFYGEPPVVIPATRFTAINARPESSSSDAHEPYPSLDDVPQHPLLLPPADFAASSTGRGKIQETYPNMDKRRLSRDEQPAKRPRFNADLRGLPSVPNVASPLSEPYAPSSFTAAIDPELEQVTETIIVNEPALLKDSSPPPIAETHKPRHTEEEYETAAILMAMSLSGSVGQVRE